MRMRFFWVDRSPRECLRGTSWVWFEFGNEEKLNGMGFSDDGNLGSSTALGQFWNFSGFYYVSGLGFFEVLRVLGVFRNWEGF